jgi:hypothetical protein
MGGPPEKAINVLPQQGRGRDNRFFVNFPGQNLIFCNHFNATPTLKKLKIRNFGRPILDAKIFFEIM